MSVESAPNRVNALLLFSTLIIAICGLIYELLAGTISSYLLGDSVFQFSLVIGLFMASMGIGSYISRFVSEKIIETFVLVQCLIAIVGGYSAYILFFSFSYLDNYQPILFILCILIGSLVGLEIPLVVRLLKTYRILRLNVSNVLTADYIGALFAALLFPLVLVPQLGLFRTSLLFGIFNCLVAALGIYIFRQNIDKPRFFISVTGVVVILLVVGFIKVDQITDNFNQKIYSGEVIYSKQTPYQKIIITRDDEVISMYLNGQLQFNSLDEYRYHESLVHPVMSLSNRRQNILILGGGDGLAVREVLKYPEVEQVTLVDLDKEITSLFRNNELMTDLNKHSLADPRVHIKNMDAWKYVEESNNFYDVIIVDLPDPSSTAISKLYTDAFYALLTKRMTADGLMVTQATSPVYAHKAFWCIHNTLAETKSAFSIGENLNVIPYRSYIPTFGEWGFVLASNRMINMDHLALTVKTKYLNAEVVPSMTSFPGDIGQIETEVNDIYTHKLVQYYNEGWEHWFR